MEWFLITDNEHLGPFTEEVLHQLFKSGELDKDSRVWKEGWEDAKSYQDVFLAKSDEFIPLQTEVESVYDSEPHSNIIKEEELPPDLPFEVKEQKRKVESVKEAIEKAKATPVIENPVDVKKAETKVSQPTKSEPVKKAVQKNVPPMAIKKNKLQKTKIKKTKPIEEADKEVSVDEVFKYDYDIKSQEKRLQKLIRHATVIGITLLLALPIFFYFNKSEVVFSRPSTMSLEDYERLIKNANDPSKDIKFAFSLAYDKRTLWISANVSLEGEIFLNLKSKRHRILGEENVEVKAKGILDKRLVTLTEFQFVQGTRFVDGYYDAEIFTVKDLEEPLFNRFFEPREKQFRYLNDVLITSLHPIEFEKELARQEAKRNSNDRKFWEDLKEEYRTVKGITNNIKESLNEVFNVTAENWLGAVDNFERNYKANYGVFFTSFVQSIDQKYDTLTKQDFNDKIKILSEYKKLNELAREIGEESMTVLENLKSTDVSGMDIQRYQDFKYNTLLKFNLIISQCEKMIEEL